MPSDAQFGLFDVLRLMACHPSVAPTASAERRASQERQPMDDGRRRGRRLLHAVSARGIAARLCRSSTKR